MLVRSSGPGSAGGWLAVPSEAGHAAFAFVGPEEQDYQAFLARELGRHYPTAENVLSGEGLSVLHYYLSGQFFYPPAVGAEALSHETPTLLWYARFWGRFCRQWILTTLCHGGLWIAGGIAAKNALCVTHPAFLQELGLVPDIGGIAASVPIYLITDGDSGLWGAACAAVEHLSCRVPCVERNS
jgi:glucokinase